MNWLLLIHQIPPKPDYLRVKIGRRLQRVGAVPVKNSVYVLPDSDQSFEDFQWIRAEIVNGGGDASICRAGFVDGLTDDQVRAFFRDARDAEYGEIAALARKVTTELQRARKKRARGVAGRPSDELTRLRKRLATVASVDFFAAAGGAAARHELERLAAELEPPQSMIAHTEHAAADRADYRARTWVTRRGIFVDRMASAWLIRRFIDPDARFTFVDEQSYRADAAGGHVRFDMFEAEFTHEDERCTFETLISRFGLADRALRPIAEVVHDIDLKDGKFGRDETVGVERVLSAIAAAHSDDSARLERGEQLFDDLYVLYSRT